MPDRTIAQTVEVTFRYPVRFTRGVFGPDNPALREVLGSGDQPKKLLFVLDAGLLSCWPELAGQVGAYAAAHPGALKLVAPPLVLPGGEGVKQDPAFVARVHGAINAAGLDRHAYVVAVGGGALIDLVGYAAATAHRGVRLVRVPTTVLSQNDSAVGVKNSVNAFGKKNWLGTFAPPYAVVNDLDFLTTLSDRDWLGGLSEAVKVALLKDPAFFAFLEAHAAELRGRDLAAMEHAVYRCAQLHLLHIATSGDAFEQGSSRPLDFGHWAAHKLEALTHYELRHGEAVALGLALDSTYALLAGMLPEHDWQRIMALFHQLGLATAHPLWRTPEAVLAGVEEFREHLGGRLTVMLLSGIGRGVEVHALDPALLSRGMALLDRLQKGEPWLPSPSAAR